MEALELALWGDESDAEFAQDELLAWSQVQTNDGPAQLRVDIQLGVVAESASEPREERQAGKKRPPSTISRRREEIAQLKVVSEYLERQLHRLLNCDVKNEYERIAAEERTQRELAERENLRLRSLLEDRNTTLSQVRQVLDLQLDRMPQRYDIMSPPPPPVSVSLRDHRDTLEALAQLLDTMYIQTDLVLSDPRLGASLESASFIDVERHFDPDALVIQLIESRFLPFHPEVAAEAEWKHYLKRSRSQSGEQYECLPDGTIRSCYAMFILFPGFQAHVKAEMALRRIEEPHRVVILRSASFTYLTTPEKLQVKNSSTARHFSWTTVSPKNGSVGCISQTCGILVPSTSGENAEEASAIANFYSDLSKKFLEEHLDEVDSFLLRSQRRKRRIV